MQFWKAELSVQYKEADSSPTKVVQNTHLLIQWRIAAVLRIL